MKVVFDMMSVQPDVTLQLAMSVIEHISPYVRSIDFALDWVLVESGQVGSFDLTVSGSLIGQFSPILFSHWLK